MTIAGELCYLTETCHGRVVENVKNGTLDCCIQIKGRRHQCFDYAKCVNIARIDSKCICIYILYIYIHYAILCILVYIYIY